MPNKKMDKKKRETYQKSLMMLKEEITNDIKQMAGSASAADAHDSGDVSGHVMHLADVATDMYDREFSLGLASNDRELIVRIDKAIRRVDDGTFGLCVECGGEIKEPRLKALPYVENCLKCQEKLEKR